MKLISLLTILMFVMSCSEKKETVMSGHEHHITPVVGKPSVMLNDTQIKLANVKVQPVASKAIGETISLNARLTADEERSQAISTRATGRIEKLFIKETGRSVRKGEPLYELYSEQLLTLQQEYVLAKEQYETLGQTEKRFQSYLKSSERKLLLYGLTQNQISKLGQSKDIQQKITFLSPIDGVVTEINAAEGQYVNEGNLLYRIEDITQLWLEAEVYPQELGLVHVGDQITVRTEGNNQTEAKVTFISPEYRAGSQISILRASLKNPEGKWKPGMQAQVLFTHSSKQAIAVPSDAVIHHGNEAYVFVQTDKNTFEPRKVKSGLEDFDQTEITEGIKEGEIIAVSGAYLLYSDFILKRGSI
ncbi:MAG TPA: efflux RND transporter periplasmic adaptor subunit [Cyclobacteriaceae bacterium]